VLRQLGEADFLFFQVGGRGKGFGHGGAAGEGVYARRNQFPIVQLRTGPGVIKTEFGF
jgi:hypothetical protein